MEMDGSDQRNRGGDRAWKRPLFIAIAALLGVALSFAILELMVRMTGRIPWHNLRLKENEPTMFEADARLGWKPIPGRHVIAPYSEGAPAIQMTLLPDRGRTTGAGGDGHAKLLFVGCSFTQGWAIPDDETFAWRLQQQFPSLSVLNRGVAAYGTYQSLLVMEQALAGPERPEMVFYGFIEEHEPRNVAAPAWLLLLALGSRAGMGSTPYCTLAEDGTLIRHEPESYTRWPLRQYSALITFLEWRYFELEAGDRGSQQQAVTEQLMLEMQRIAEQHSSRFCVVLLHVSPTGRAHYVDFLERHHIDFVDCAYPITDALHVRGEVHPNGVMNQRYADCIAEKIAATGIAYR